MMKFTFLNKIKINLIIIITFLMLILPFNLKAVGTKSYEIETKLLPFYRLLLNQGYIPSDELADTLILNLNFPKTFSTVGPQSSRTNIKFYITNNSYIPSNPGWLSQDCYKDMNSHVNQGGKKLEYNCTLNYRDLHEMIKGAINDFYIDGNSETSYNEYTITHQGYSVKIDSSTVAKYGSKSLVNPNFNKSINLNDSKNHFSVNPNSATLFIFSVDNKDSDINSINNLLKNTYMANSYVSNSTNKLPTLNNDEYRYYNSAITSTGGLAINFYSYSYKLLNTVGNQKTYMVYFSYSVTTEERNFKYKPLSVGLDFKAFMTSDKSTITPLYYRDNLSLNEQRYLDFTRMPEDFKDYYSNYNDKLDSILNAISKRDNFIDKKVNETNSKFNEANDTISNIISDTYSDNRYIDDATTMINTFNVNDITDSVDGLQNGINVFMTISNGLLSIQYVKVVVMVSLFVGIAMFYIGRK